jgi:lipopolysaccharide export system permease protein
MDANLFKDNAQAKSLPMLNRGVDSLSARLDSIGRDSYTSYSHGFLRQTVLEGRRDSAELVERAVEHPLDYDTLYANLSESERASVAQKALEQARSGLQQTEFMREDNFATNRTLRIHKLERHKKFTLSLACIIFFFIGAPLGAIIRKGGLGVPVVISVIIFILYYIINHAGEAMAKSGTWETAFGAWLSTMVLVPVAVWLTWKSNKDSAVFNIEAYQKVIKKILKKLHI